MTDDFPLKNETHQILGACFEVYNSMGSGFLESVYQECLEMELATRNSITSASSTRKTSQDQ